MSVDWGILSITPEIKDLVLLHGIKRACCVPEIKNYGFTVIEPITMNYGSVIPVSLRICSMPLSSRH